jgi:hypothetical protein
MEEGPAEPGPAISGQATKVASSKRAQPTILKARVYGLELIGLDEEDAIIAGKC